MTHRSDCTLPPDFLERIAEQGFDILPELIRTVGTQPCKLNAKRTLVYSLIRGLRSGGITPMVASQRPLRPLGEIAFGILQVRRGELYPSEADRTQTHSAQAFAYDFATTH